MIKRLKDKYIGDKAFYLYIIGIVVPMILQNVVTNFVSLLDNIMVGQIGTEQMSGVAIVNQFMFVFNISVFGAISGPGIFGAQFRGKGDYEGQKYTFRFRLIIAFLFIVAAGIIFRVWDNELISLYLNPENAGGDIVSTLAYGKQYMSIMVWGTIPFAVGQTYASVIRECEETKIPMIGSFAAVGINLFLDYALIFGKFGFPEMGVRGAAIATVVAKTIEALVCVVWAHMNPEKNPYIVGLYKGFAIPWKLTKNMIIKGLPLMVNEFLWAYGMAAVNQCYAVRGLEVVAAQNICGTMTNLFGVIYIQLGACISIVVGQKLGAGKVEEAKDYDNKMIAFSVAACAVVAVIMLPIARFFPYLYKTDASIRALATFFILVQACVMPLWAFSNASYFTLRSGGNTLITFIFDSVFTWLIMIPLVFCLTHFTGMNIKTIFIIVNYSEIIKVTMGYFMVKSNMWINNIVDE